MKKLERLSPIIMGIFGIVLIVDVLIFICTIRLSYK